MLMHVSRIGLLVASAVFSLLQACGPDDGGVGAGRGGATGISAGAGGVAIGNGNAGTNGSSTTGQGSGTAGAVGSVGSGGADGLGGAAGTGEVGSGGSADAGGAVDAGRATDASGAADAPVHLDDTLRTRVVAGMVPLQAWYNTSTGLFDRNDWWTSGNQLEAVIDYTRELGDMKYFADIDNTFEKNKGNNFDKWGFYDDDGWWAIVWIKAYDLTKQQKYLDMAKTIFKRMAGSWDTKCGGGIYWRQRQGQEERHPQHAVHAGSGQAAPPHAGRHGDQQLPRLGAAHVDVVQGLGNAPGEQAHFRYPQQPHHLQGRGAGLHLQPGRRGGRARRSGGGTGDATLLDEASAIARATMSMMQVNGILKEAPCGGETLHAVQGRLLPQPAHASIGCVRHRICRRTCGSRAIRSGT